MTTPARTRIAPSPTGDPHVGTAYMALYNRALAQGTGGQFLFRLDDTDRARRDETSEQQLYDALKWLGLEYQEGPDIGGPYAPYRQSERNDIYWGYVEKMLESGAAYRCFATADELSMMRKIQEKEGRPTSYDRRWRGKSKEEIQAKLDAGDPFVVRVAMPTEGDVVFEDLLRGPIRIPSQELDDKVIWKSDGFPTYHLANVVDDHEFKITHIIRGEEWIPSVPVHIVMMDALGFTRPTMIHMPLLRNADKSKVSKRRNPTSLLWYRDAGIMPEGMLNFLGLMGYSVSEESEIFSFEDFVSAFKPEKIALGGPVFDLRKLEWCNGEHMRMLSDEELLKRLVAHFELVKAAGSAPLDAQEAAIREDENILWPDAKNFNKQEYAQKFRVQTLLRNRAIVEHADTWIGDQATLAGLMPLLNTRLHTLSEAADYLPPFFSEIPALPVEDLAKVKKFDSAQQAEALEALIPMIDAQDFEAEGAAEALEAKVREFVEAKEWKVGSVFMTLRLSALRAKVSPPLFESMMVLGHGVTMVRIADAVANLKG